ncbi:MAG: hypothetical protein AAF570_22700, partial [Bacteroidota bacterium]
MTHFIDKPFSKLICTLCGLVMMFAFATSSFATTVVTVTQEFYANNTIPTVHELTDGTVVITVRADVECTLTSVNAPTVRILVRTDHQSPNNIVVVAEPNCPMPKLLAPRCRMKVIADYETGSFDQ